MRKPTTGPSQRQLRVAEEIRHVLALAFERRNFRDPELAAAQVTVTEVRIGPDLKRAVAFVARLGREDIDAILPALNRAAPFLRRTWSDVPNQEERSYCRPVAQAKMQTNFGAHGACGPKLKSGSRTIRTELIRRLAGEDKRSAHG